MDTVKKAQSTEYFKIRQRLLNIIFRSGPAAVRIASSRELCREFGVAHMTVARVLKDLAADGYLVIKRGVGAFTNPKNSNVTSASRVIGIVIGDGKYMFFDRIELAFFSAFADEVLRHSQKNWVQNCTLLSPSDDAALELSQNSLDGIVWLLPHDRVIPAIKRLKQQGMPIVCVGRKVEGVSSCYVDYYDESFQAAKLMLAQGRTRILLVLMEQPLMPQENAVEGVEKAFAESGGTFDRTMVISGTEDDRRTFGRILERSQPDGIIFHDSVRPYWGAIQANPDLAGRCLFISSEWEIRGDMGYHGYTRVPDLKYAAEMAAENLESQLSNQAQASVLNLAIPFHMKKE